MPDLTPEPGCDAVRDVLPELLHGRLAGEVRARAERHVAACAIAVIVVQGSAIGMAPVATWSQRNTPSHPAASARTASSTRTIGSPNGPNGGR